MLPFKITNLSDELIKNINEIESGFSLENIRKEIAKMEVNLIKEVLFNYLHREPTIEDFKITKILIDLSDEYSLLYDNKCLGMVKYYLNENPIRLTFFPNKCHFNIN